MVYEHLFNQILAFQVNRIVAKVKSGYHNIKFIYTSAGTPIIYYR